MRSDFIMFLFSFLLGGKLCQDGRMIKMCPAAQVLESSKCRRADSVLCAVFSFLQQRTDQKKIIKTIKEQQQRERSAGQGQTGTRLDGVAK
jgi:hypothetical protein